MILIVDDDEPTCRVMKRLFEGHGYDVRTAGTIGEGMNLIRQRFPKLIILDVMLQHTNGLQLLDMLRNNPDTRRIPVLIHTACMSPGTEEEARKLGAAGLLQKGVTDVTSMMLRIRSFVEPKWPSCQIPPRRIA